jgi:hypothetical protein
VVDRGAEGGAHDRILNGRLAANRLDHWSLIWVIRVDIVMSAALSAIPGTGHYHIRPSPVLLVAVLRPDLQTMDPAPSQPEILDDVCPTAVSPNGRNGSAWRHRQAWSDNWSRGSKLSATACARHGRGFGVARRTWIAQGQPARLEKILSSVLNRRGERAERQTSHIAELRKRAAEADAKLTRLYDAIENGIADLADLKLKDRIAELKGIRDQARADAERAAGALDRLGPSITPPAIKTFARTARRRMRTESGGYRRDHLRALAQRVEVDAKQVRIMGSKSVLLRTLVTISGAKTAGFGVTSFVPKWRPREDSNLRPTA